jgi:zinc protease
MKKITPIVILVLFVQFVFAQQSSIPVDERLVSGQLENGMMYFIQHHEKPEDRAEIRLALKAGSILEDEDQLGLAHFIEHMAFNGTEHFEKNELINYLEGTGAKFGPDLNAYTSFDETVYMLQVRTDDEEILDKGLLIFQDWAGGLMFNHEEIDKERGVVISEWRTRLSPDQRMQKEYYPVMYHGSRYADRLPIGDPEIVENADYEVIKRFYKDWYRPDLMAIIIVGDVDVKQMEMEIKKRFSGLTNPKNPRDRTEYNVPDHNETLISICSDPEASFTNARMMIKHDQQKMNSQDDYRTNLLSNLYNRMINSRLDELSQKADPPFTYAYTGYGRSLGDIDTYTSFAMTAEGKSMKGLQTILEENERVKRHGFLASELERQKQEMMTSAESALKEMDKVPSSRLVMRYVYHFLKDQPVPSPKQTLDLYKEFLPGIQVEEINQLAKQWLKDENRVFVLTGPDKADVPMPAESEVRSLIDKISQIDIGPYVDNVLDEPLFEAELQPRKIVEKVSLETIGVEEWLLENGVKVIVKQTDFKNDEVLMGATSEGGHSLYGDEMYPSATFSSDLINESGIGAFDLIQLQKKLTGKIVNVSPYIGERYEGFRGSASPQDLETMFQLIYLYFSAPRQDESTFQSMITKQKAIYKNLLSNPNYYFFNETMKIKSDNHVRRGFPTEEMLDKIDFEEAIQIYKDRFADASDFTFMFVGAFDKEILSSYVQTYLGNLPSSQREETFKDVGADFKKGKNEVSFNFGQAPKSQVDMTFHGQFEWNAKNRYVLRSMIDVLRIKLRETMREELGGVYGVRVSGSGAQYPKPEYSITISFNSEPERTQELIDAANKVIKGLKENGPESEDIQKVTETQRQDLTKNLKENRFWSRQLEYAYENKLDPGKITLENLEESISELSADDIKSALNQYFDYNNYFKIEMHPDNLVD